MGIKVVDPIPPGTVVAVTEGELSAGAQQLIINGIEAVSGHNKFCVLFLPNHGDVEVWGPDADLVANLNRLLAER